HLTSYICFLRKILPYQLKSLEEECESSLCTSALRARNLELSQDMKKMTAVFEKLQTYIALLALPILQRASSSTELLMLTWQKQNSVIFGYRARWTPSDKLQFCVNKCWCCSAWIS
ncbi:PPP1R21 isoform 7, partial [Pongo abelii]